MINNEALVDIPVSLTVSLTDSEGKITEETAGLGYSVVDINSGVPTIVEVMLVGRDVLEYSVIDKDKGIEDATNSNVIEGKIDDLLDVVAIMVIAVSIVMTWDSVLLIVFPTAVSITVEDMKSVGVGL